MTDWPTLPRIVLSTRTSRLVTVGALADTALAAGMDGLDLDLSGRLWPPGPARIAADLDDGDVSVEGVWVNRVVAGPAVAARQRRALVAALATASSCGAEGVVVEHQGALDRWASAAQRALMPQVLRDAVDASGSRLVVALPANQLEGNRRHLTELTALRRTAEEWDFDLALDLLGPIDPRWEAEAAVARLVPRLRLIRVGPLDSRPAGRHRARITRRTLSAAADSGFHGAIAVAVGPGWHAWWPGTLTRLCAETTARIRDRFALIREPFAGDPFPGPRLP